ncbi:hypothetical protein [Anatilimnocola floriformis]|uniref:hypothetical protein n=1 Tax=Anatilimnocola floriformis TaxID=2948575 RepID=UPI0020C4F9DF|nr:hypothetical protein [Anatilimnocola floriformis]
MNQTPAFDPYHELLGIGPSEQPASLYRLLGVTNYESNPTVIERAADRQMAHLRTFQAGKHQADSQRLLNELTRARQTLLNDKERAAYDVKLKQQIAEKEKPATPLKIAKAIPLSATPAPVVAQPLAPAPIAPAPITPAPLVAQPLYALPVQPVAAQPTGELNLALNTSHTRKKPAKRSSSPMLGLLIVGVLVAGIGVAFFVFNRPSPVVVKNEPRPKTPTPKADPAATPKPAVTKAPEPTPPSEPKPATVDQTPATPVAPTIPQPPEPIPVTPIPEPVPATPDIPPETMPPETSPPVEAFVKERAEVAAAREALQSLPKFKKYYDHLAANPDSLAVNGPKLAAIVQTEVASNATIREHAPSHLAALQEVERLATAGGDYKLALPAIDAQLAHSLPLLTPEAARTAKGKLFEAAADTANRQKAKQSDREALLTVVRGLLREVLSAVDVETLAAIIAADAKLGWTANEKFESVQFFLPFAEQEVGQEQAATSTLLLEHLDAQLTKSPVGKPRKEALDAVIALREQLKLVSDVQQAKKVLAATPQDPAANQTLAVYLLMQRGEWRESLDHFAQGSQPEWKTLAAETLQAKTTAEKIGLADRWAGSEGNSSGNSSGKEIARHLYQEALADTALVGIPRAAAEEKAKTLGPSPVKVAALPISPAVAFGRPATRDRGNHQNILRANHRRLFERRPLVGNRRYRGDAAFVGNGRAARGEGIQGTPGTRPCHRVFA